MEFLLIITEYKVNIIKDYAIFFNSVLRPFQDYFSSYERGQSVGGAKTEPREKSPGTPASRTWLVSYVASVGLEPTALLTTRPWGPPLSNLLDSDQLIGFHKALQLLIHINSYSTPVLIFALWA